MSSVDVALHNLVKYIMLNGKPRTDRTGWGTKGIFGHQIKLNLQEGFPIVSIKKTHFKSIVAEMLWMLRGDTNVKWLNEHGVTIWNEWQGKNGDLGPIYGAQWRHWRVLSDIDRLSRPEEHFLDQVAILIEGLRRRPFSRRHVLSAWNVADLPDEAESPQNNVDEYGLMALAPCHVLAQFHVRDDGDDRTLSCHVYQRSCDVFLGLPFNLAGYALLTHILANALGYEVGDLIWSGGDVHLYTHHFDQAETLLERNPLYHKAPTLKIAKSLTPGLILNDQLEVDWFTLKNYTHDDAIAAPVAV
jgi:thymidylate synthase